MHFRKKKPVKESVIESYFIRRMREEYPGAQIHKYEIRKSEPDRLCLLPGGRAVFVELKRPGASLREDQARAAERLHDLGFECYWAPTKEEVDEVISKIKLEELL